MLKIICRQRNIVSLLRIAFETFDLVEQSAELLEHFSKKAPNCEIILFTVQPKNSKEG